MLHEVTVEEIRFERLDSARGKKLDKVYEEKCTSAQGNSFIPRGVENARLRNTESVPTVTMGCDAPGHRLLK
jgi:hypothetical protein